MKTQSMRLALSLLLLSSLTSAQLVPQGSIPPDGERFLPPQLQKMRQDKNPGAETPPPYGIFKATGGVDTAWVRYYRSLLTVPAQDRASAVVVDLQGNVYVTGASEGSSTSWDFTTIKYTSAGDTVWTRRYNTSYNGHGGAPLLAVDEGGNVYVAGPNFNYNEDISADYTTIKYNPIGDTVWVRHYNGPANLMDYVTALAVDHTGNVYVTGVSVTSLDYILNIPPCDYVTIKYNSAGDTIWVRRYNGPSNWADYATALAVDDSGNVFVTGESWDFEAPEGLPQPTQCATIKYNSIGDVVWVSRYETPTRNRNWPGSLAVDDNGNIYLGVRGFVDFDHKDYLYEYVTIKYNPVGDTVWTRIYDGPGDNRDILASLAIDKSGYVYVTGHSEKSSDHVSVGLVTLKYNSAGDTVWTKTYSGPENSDDRAQSLVVDEGGNVYVVGGGQGSGTKRDYLTIKYDSAGDTVWVSRYDGTAHDVDYPASLALDGGGDVYVTGTSYLDTQAYASAAFATVKYNSAGDTVWARLYNAPRSINASNRATAFDLDASGNVYITGNAIGVSDISAVATVKYNAPGDTEWAKSYLGPNSVAGQPGTFSVDESGNVYVAGTISSPIGLPPDAFIVIKHNSIGEIAWTRRYNGPANGSAWAASLAVDESGYVYVAGSSRDSDIPADYTTIKYDSAGDTVWVSRYNGVWNSTDEATSLGVDHNGNVYVTGNSWSSFSSPNPTSDFATVKYNSSGDTLWARDYNGPANRSDQARVIVVDAQGNVYVTGSANLDNDIQGRTTKSDYATIRYNSVGDRLWARTYNGPGDGVDIPTALAVDGGGNAFVAGYSQDGDSSYDCTTIRYSPAGDTLWVRRYPQTSASPVFLTVDAGGNTYITLSCGDADSSNATIKYSSSGAEEWVARYPHFANAVGIRLDNEGNVYVAGTGLAPEGPRYAVIKYAQRPTSIMGGTSPVPTTFVLEQNYPNPFNPSTTIRYGLPHKSAVQLTIFNILGQQVAILQNGEQEAGYHEVKFEASGFASGMYFYRLSVAGDFVQTKKFILVR